MVQEDAALTSAEEQTDVPLHPEQLPQEGLEMWTCRASGRNEGQHCDGWEWLHVLKKGKPHPKSPDARQGGAQRRRPRPDAGSDGSREDARTARSTPSKRVQSSLTHRRTSAETPAVNHRYSEAEAPAGHRVSA